MTSENRPNHYRECSSCEPLEELINLLPPPGESVSVNKLTVRCSTRGAEETGIVLMFGECVGSQQVNPNFRRPFCKKLDERVSCPHFLKAQS